jgi:DNA gyrase subunit A
VRLQRLDAGDRLTEVVLVPPAPDDEDADAEAEAGTAAPTDSTDAAATDA